MALKPTEEIREIVERYYRILLSEGFPLEKIYLFGSYSGNKQNENSDIDLAVVLRKFSKDRFNTRLELMKYSRQFKEVIEPHPFLLSEFNKSDPFVSEILDTGIEVFS
ncbi:MAG: nucleotidyltransferase domain-containing protein [Ignavibacteriaceae bacterium]